MSLTAGARQREVLPNESGYTTGNKRKKEKHWKVDRVTASQDWRRFHGKESSPLEEIRELG
jgi:hypothetical protein